MDRVLTETELELMLVLWTHGDSTPRQVLEQLPPGRAYTTVSTILNILLDKGFVQRAPQGRTHLYSPVLSQAEFRGQTVTRVVDRLFGGSPLSLMRQLVQRRPITSDELADLKKLVDSLEES